MLAFCSDAVILKAAMGSSMTSTCYCDFGCFHSQRVGSRQMQQAAIIAEAQRLMNTIVQGGGRGMRVVRAGALLLSFGA